MSNMSYMSSSGFWLTRKAQQIDGTCSHRSACVEWDCDHLLALDGEAHLENADAVRLLLAANRSIVAPLLVRVGQLWSSFWGAVDERGYYARSDNYSEIVDGTRKCACIILYIYTRILVRSSCLQCYKALLVSRIMLNIRKFGAGML